MFYLSRLGRLLNLGLVYRIQFEEEQLQLTRNRLTTLQKTQEEEEAKVVELEEQKRQIQAEIASGREAIENLRQGLQGLNEALEEKNKVVEQVKKTHARAAKVLDQALKEIGSMARDFPYLLASLTNYINPRTMKLRSWRLNDRRCTVNVD